VEVLRDFAAKYSITYTLLSDEGSKVIRALGLFNDQVYEHHAAYGIPKQDRVWGVPYPGVFVLDAHGDVVQKRFQQSYRERETGVGLLQQGFGIASTRHGTEVHAQAEGVQVCAYLDSDTYRFFQRLWLTVDLTIAPGLHVYGPPMPAGSMPLSIDIAPVAGLVVGVPQWPTPHPWHVVGLDEQFFVYEGKVIVSVPVTLTQEDDQTLQVTVRYQACSATDCFVPRTVELQVSVQAAEHIERPRRR
jgi:cytochrome c biogenesis DsbD-like protein/AhpC/TSA family protein